MTEWCFLFDENTTPALADQLRRRQPMMTVYAIGVEPAPPKGIADPELLLWLEKQGVSLVTKNRKSMPTHLRDHLNSGHHIPAIFIVRPQVSLREVIDDLILIREASNQFEFMDQIIYIPL